MTVTATIPPTIDGVLGCALCLEEEEGEKDKEKTEEEKEYGKVLVEE